MRIFFTFLIIFVLVSCSKTSNTNTIVITKLYDSKEAYGNIEIKQQDNFLSISSNLTNVRPNSFLTALLVDNNSCSSLKLDSLNIVKTLKQIQSSSFGASFSNENLSVTSTLDIEHLYGLQFVVLNSIYKSDSKLGYNPLEICFDITKK